MGCSFRLGRFRSRKDFFVEHNDRWFCHNRHSEMSFCNAVAVMQCRKLEWGSGTGKLKERFAMAEPEVNLTRTYDAVIVGSGAAGGMAAHVLTTHGLQVLMLEAGKKVDTTAELHSMEWPFDHPRRGEIPYSSHALRGKE